MDGYSSCELCPEGAACTPNSTTASLVLLPGYWRLSTRTDALYACAEGDVSYSACAGGTAVCHPHPHPHPHPNPNPNPNPNLNPNPNPYLPLCP